MSTFMARRDIKLVQMSGIPKTTSTSFKTFILHQSTEPPLYKGDLKVKDVSEPSPTFTINGNLRIIGVKVIDVGEPSDE